MKCLEILITYEHIRVVIFGALFFWGSPALFSCPFKFRLGASNSFLCSGCPNTEAARLIGSQKLPLLLSETSILLSTSGVELQTSKDIPEA